MAKKKNIKIEIDETLENIASEANEEMNEEFEETIEEVNEVESENEIDADFETEAEVENEDKRGIFDKLRGKKKKEKIDPLEELKIQKAELNDKYVRLFAEFDNFKKRTAKERIELMKTASKDVVVDMLSVLDDFDRATKAANEARENEKPVDLDGFSLIQNKIKTTLANKGLQEMETNGMPFDSELHDAITEIPAPSDELKGKIVDTIEKGYYMNDVIIRHAKVVVGK